MTTDHRAVLTDTLLAPRWRAPARLAWLALVGLLLGLYAYDIGPSRLAHDVTIAAIAWNVGTPIGFALIGGLIFWRKSDDWMGLLTSFALIGMGVYLLAGVGEDLALRPEWRLANSLLEGLTGAAFALFAFLFPDGRFVPWRARPVVLGLVGIVILTFVIGSIANWPSQSVVSGFWVAVGAAVVLQVYRYFRVSGPLQRQQTKWVVAGLVSPMAVTLEYFFYLAPHQADLAATGIAAPVYVVDMLLALLLPLAIAISILRYHLWDIDILINRALVYGSLTLLLAFGYLGAVVVLQAVFQAATGQARSELVTVLSTLLIAAIAAPLRRRLQSAIDRRFYRRHYDAVRTLADFGTTLRDNVDLDQLSIRLVAVVDDTMQPDQASLWIKP